MYIVCAVSYCAFARLGESETFDPLQPIAGAFGGLLASGILKLDSIGSLHTWRMIFVIEGERERQGEVGLDLPLTFPTLCSLVRYYHGWTWYSLLLYHYRQD